MTHAFSSSTPEAEAEDCEEFQGYIAKPVLKKEEHLGGSEVQRPPLDSVRLKD